MTLRRILKSIFAGAVLLGSALVGPGLGAKGPAAGPALWKVADKDTIIYLFGTIHILPKEAQWRTASLNKALAQSETLVLETIMDDPAKSAQLVVSLGSSPGLPPLSQRVPPDKREALQGVVRASGMPATVLDGMESWAAAMTLMGVAFAQSGFNSDLGVESQLTAAYKQANKPLLGLETVEQQLGFLDTLSEEAQRTLLVSAIDDPAAAQAELQRMLDAWLKGDVETIAATFDSETQLSPELRQALIHKRNLVWTDWIAARLAQPGTIFVAVGAGHLAGADSVQQMLKQRGIKVRRLN